MAYLLLAPLAYQLIALLASIKRLFQTDPPPTAFPPISILKPVYGADPQFYAALRSHAAQDYPHFEILFSVASPDDPAVPHIERLMAEFPHRPIRLLSRETVTPNRKVGALIDLVQAARYDVLLINDGDILAPPNYLRTIMGGLEQPGVGLVTALYRGRAESVAGLAEALGVATDFAPSALVAPLVGVAEFAMGSTLLLRRADLAAIGGMEVLADRIADDYQLGLEISKLGKRVHLSTAVVETSLGARGWREAHQHQLRWARTIRVSRGGVIGYLGMPVTFATVWAIVALLAGEWALGFLLLAMRLNVAIVAGMMGLEDRNVLWLLGFVPLRDLWGAAVWVNGLWGDTVEWGGRRLRLRADGRIVE
ncbi:MAG: bacteriohopanetetrol glucosamine biosynthesis glycosyltransferase HpnI [Acidobacteriota bacterium]|jgi:ceramide glucosyltransferase|nr:bacteriohopanetetrol glucosamine biosynthesis glycosyltransferase HpnI [Acidobacteriaceae bacterium]